MYPFNILMLLCVNLHRKDNLIQEVSKQQLTISELCSRPCLFRHKYDTILTCIVRQFYLAQAEYDHDVSIDAPVLSDNYK